MSDGPHRSLPMRKEWQRLAERADKPAWTQEEVTEAMPSALDSDWREDGCDEVVASLRAILGVGTQGALFVDDAMGELDRARRQLTNGAPLRRLIIDHVQLALANGDRPADALKNGVESALRERAARARYQVEEHFHRKTHEERALGVGKRIEDAMSRCAFDALARHYIGEVSSHQTRLEKNKDLDDGVALP